MLLKCDTRRSNNRRKTIYNLSITEIKSYGASKISINKVKIYIVTEIFINHIFDKELESIAYI